MQSKKFFNDFFCNDIFHFLRVSFKKKNLFVIWNYLISEYFGLEFRTFCLACCACTVQVHIRISTNYFFTFHNFSQDLQHEMTTWKILNLCRSIAVIFGWMIVSLRPNTDLLYKNLEKLSNYNTPPSAVYKTAWKMKIK